MKKILLVLPGASDPKNSENQKTYNIFEKYANEYGFSHVIVPSYKGQKSYDTQNWDEGTLQDFIDEIKLQLDVLEKQPIEYRIIARSMACPALLELLKANNYKKIEKVFMWGFAPIGKYYYELVKIRKKTDIRLLKKDTKLAKDIFYEIVPLTVSLIEIKDKKLNYDILFCSGTEDDHYPQNFHEYLKSLDNNKRIFFPDLLEGLGHSVNIKDNNYLDLLLK